MMLLSLEEIKFLLALIREKYGDGYADDNMVARLQAKLSVMGEAKIRAAEITGGGGDV